VKQRGFSLIEMAIVLVIVGLILGGILASRSIIAGMQAKDVIAIANDLRAATAIFQQRYHYLPGDWVYTANEIPNVTTGGDGNGAIGTAAEVANVPVHLFNASLIRTPTLSSHFGGVQVISAATSGIAGFQTNTVNVILFFNLSCDAVQEVDLKLDDGDISMGNGLASVANCTPGGTNDPVPLYAVALQ
jgi:prepilin-type N-terminal cleavage/methylation domain-containing protein